MSPSSTCSSTFVHRLSNEAELDDRAMILHEARVGGPAGSRQLGPDSGFGPPPRRRQDPTGGPGGVRKLSPETCVRSENVAPVSSATRSASPRSQAERSAEP